ncbi:MAG: 7-cyano-7-deazaguanine synthase QueC [Thermomicrobium sp.]|nr:7-cyano-7-deazaguanine synthase QueC [Thermomicrobium sp.]
MEPRKRSQRAVVLLSGGLDSTTLAYLLDAYGFVLYGLSFRYGQRHERELEAARAIAEKLRFAEHRVVTIDLAQWGGSSLVGSGEIPRQPTSGIPSTYVPVRNLVFLAIAHAYAEAIDADAVAIAVSQVDYSGYPDCRGEFLAAYQQAADLASRRFVETGRRIPVLPPFLDVPKSAIVRLGLRLGVDYAETWSCYRGGERPCQECDSCRLRVQAFAEAGVPDPLLQR